MATQLIRRIHEAGKDVYIVVVDSTFNFLDFDDWTFKSLMDCIQPNLNSTPRTGGSGYGMSLYDAYLDLTLLNDTDTPLDITVIAFEQVGGEPDPAADSVIAQLFGETVKNGEVLADLPDINEFAERLVLLLGSRITVVSPNVDGAVTLYANSDYRPQTVLLTFICPDAVSWPNLSEGHYDRIEFHATIGFTKKWGTATVIKATPPNQEVAVAFTREELNEMAAADTSPPTYNVQPGSFSAALMAGIQSLNRYAVFAFDDDCNQFVLSTGPMAVVKTPFDSENSTCPIG